jgi:hypothetical protein
MDIQGGELLALSGTTSDFFDELYIIVTETWFKPFYDNQPLFDDYINFFKSKGFSLLDLSPIRNAHNINIYPFFDRTRFELGSQQLYSDMILIKNNCITDQHSLIKLILGLMIEYRYSDIWEYYHRNEDLLDKGLKIHFSNLFREINNLFN